MQDLLSLVRAATISMAALSAIPMAQAAGDHGAHSGASATQQASAEMTDGEVRKVDKDAKKITLKHGTIKNLDMPPMTMVFQVKDPAMLDAVKQGDKVRFKVEKAGSGLVLTELQSAQ